MPSISYGARDADHSGDRRVHQDHDRDHRDRHLGRRDPQDHDHHQGRQGHHQDGVHQTRDDHQDLQDRQDHDHHQDHDRQDLQDRQDHDHHQGRQGACRDVHLGRQVEDRDALRVHLGEQNQGAAEFVVRRGTSDAEAVEVWRGDRVDHARRVHQAKRDAEAWWAACPEVAGDLVQREVL